MTNIKRIRVIYHVPGGSGVMVLSSNPARGNVYSIQHHAIKSGFLRILWFHSPIKTDRHDIRRLCFSDLFHTVIIWSMCMTNIKRIRVIYHVPGGSGVMVLNATFDDFSGVHPLLLMGLLLLNARTSILWTIVYHLSIF
jgi:hypothetical protein